MPFRKNIISAHIFNVLRYSDIVQALFYFPGNSTTTTNLPFLHFEKKKSQVSSGRPRLRLLLLYLPCEHGGLKLSNMRLYYRAAQLGAAIYYFHNTEVPAWVKRENNAIELPLLSYLYSSQAKTLGKRTQSPFLKNTLNIWHEYQTFLNDTSKLSCFTPIWGNENFTDGRRDMGFRHWMEKGICQIKDPYTQGTLMSLTQLKAKYNLPGNHQFKYLQLRSFICSQTKSTSEPSLSTMKQLLVNNLHY